LPLPGAPRQVDGQRRALATEPAYDGLEIPL